MVVKMPVKLTPGWRALPAILLRIVLRSIMTAAWRQSVDKLLTLIHQKEKHHTACELRPATQYDTDAVYALICELKQAEFDHQAFRVGFNANLRDPNMRYQLALLDGEVVGMIGLAFAVSSASCQLDRRNSGTGGDAARRAV